MEKLSDNQISCGRRGGSVWDKISYSVSLIFFEAIAGTFGEPGQLAVEKGDAMEDGVSHTMSDGVAAGR